MKNKNNNYRLFKIFYHHIFQLIESILINYSLFINIKCGILDIVAGYDVLYSQPCKSSSFASWTSVTAAISTTFFLRKVVLLVSGILNLCLCSLPFSSIGFHMVFPVTESSPIFWKAINCSEKPALLHMVILASFFDKAALMLPLDLIH